MTRQPLAAALLLAALQVQGEETAEDAATPATDNTNENTPAEAIWSGNAELGFIETTGNSDTQSLNGKFSLVRDKQPLKTALKLEALSSRENGNTSNEKYAGSLKFDYTLDEYDYVTSLLTYEDDRFSGYEYQSTFTLGYGYRAWSSDRGNLDFEAGPGYRRNVLEDGEVEDEAVGRLGLNLLVKIGDNAEFTEVFSVEGGDTNVIYKSDMGLKSTLVGQLAMKINYQVKYTETVPEDTENTESQFGVTLVYSF